MPKTLVLFSSRTGHTAALANAIAEGASSVRFAEVDVRFLPALALPETTGDPERTSAHDALLRKYRPLEAVERLADYDGLILGAPTRNGVMAAELEHLLRQARSLFGGGKLVDKAGSAFTTAPDGGSAEATLWSIMKPLAAMGMILVPPGSTGAAAEDSPYGATSTGDREPGAAELAVARHQGKRVAAVAAMVAHVRSHHHH